MKYLSTKEFAERVGVQQQTVINWSNKGVFKEHHKTPGGHRCYTEEQVEKFLNGDTSTEQGKQ
jgi:excisionase family DNA binding protein